MKVRSGFVSNSSSSSFVCPICGEDGDANYTDTIFCDKCSSEFCENCASTNRIKKTGENCPVCNLEIIDYSDKFAYLLKSRGLDEKLIETEIRAFKTITELRKWLRRK